MDVTDDIIDAPEETRCMEEEPSENLSTKSTEQNNKDDSKSRKSTTPSETYSNKGKSTEKLDLKPQITLKTFVRGQQVANKKSGMFLRSSTQSFNTTKKDSADNITQDNRGSYLSAKISESNVEKTKLRQMTDSGDAIQMLPGLPSSSKHIQKRFKAGPGSKINLTMITRKSLPRKSKNNAMRLMRELNNNKLLRNEHKIVKPQASKRNQKTVSYVSLSETDRSLCSSCVTDDGYCRNCGHTCCGNAMVE